MGIKGVITSCEDGGVGRRQLCGTLLLLVLCPLGTAGGGAQRRDVLRLEKITDDLFVIYGNGGNTCVYAAPEGLVVVDSKHEEDGPDLVRLIHGAFPNRPLKFLVNTHYHADHTHGNPAFPEETEIVAHENTKLSLLRLDTNYWRGPRERGLPRRLVKERDELTLGADRVEVLYYGRGHTDGDVAVFFPRVRAVHTGDLFVYRTIPVVDTQSGGSPRELLATLEKIAALKDVDWFITGHGEIANRKQFQDYCQMLKEMESAARIAVKEKTTPAKFLENLRMDRYAAWRGYPERLRQNATLLFEELRLEAEGKKKE